MTAEQFIKKLEDYRSDEEREKYKRYFTFGPGTGDEFIGVRMGQVFALAKEFMKMPPDEIEKLLESPIHEIRTGAVSIMDWRARNKKTSEEERKELFDLYLRRHDRINSWDLVDRSAQWVVGAYLFDKPRDVLYELARSKNVWERRTAILATSYFIKKGELDDTFKIAEILLNDGEETIHKAVGWMLRYAGDKDQPRLLGFLNKHAATMPRILLRNSIEKLDKGKREYYMGIRGNDLA